MQLDHIAVSGETLTAAIDKVETTLGVSIQPGGRHDAFGTHNALLGLADGLYLEAIAIDPAAAQPERARCFDLDKFAGAARLTNWICRTDDMTASLAQLPKGVGAPIALQRGDFRWLMSAPETGQQPFDDLHPTLIQWQSPVHPSSVLTASGCALHRLVVSHPDAQSLQAAMGAEFSDPRVVFEAGPKAVMAEIDTPQGRRVLQ